MPSSLDLEKLGRMLENLDVFCTGETMVMVTPQNGGPLIADSSYLLRPGGAESNVATTLASLGHSAMWASALGADPLGDLALREIASYGVNVELVVRDLEHRTGVYFKDPSPDGTTVHYYRDGSAATHMSADVLELWTRHSPRVVHVTGITAALSKTWRDLLYSIIVDRAFGASLVSFDVNYRRALWPLDDASSVLLELASASDIVFVGRDEAQTLWGTRTARDVNGLLKEPAHVVVKDGGLEAWEFHGGLETRSAAPTIEIVEPVGAGDAFAAGWLAGVLRGHDSVERLRLGHLLASRVLSSTSDFAPAPSAKEISDAVNADPSRWSKPSISIQE
jgi:2-dehydro-3-deoxygluconokinase